MLAVWDLLSFFLVLFLPCIVVMAYFVFYRPIGSSQDFMYGKYTVHWSWVGVSLAGSALSPFTLLWPSEYTRTGSTWLIGAALGFLVALPVVIIFNIPILHYNRSCSIFQYLQDRFRSKFLRYTVLIFNTSIGLIFCSIVLYLSAQLAQHSLRISPLGEFGRGWMLVLVLGALSGAVAVSGGQKAATLLGSFTLLFEFIVMLICVVAMGIFRRHTSSFYTAVIRDDNEDNSSQKQANPTILNVPDRPSVDDKDDWFSYLTPEYRVAAIIDQQNVWLSTFACVLYFFYFFGCHQTSHQHYCAVSTKRRARLALVTTLLVHCVVWCLSFVLICLMIIFYTAPNQSLQYCFSLSSFTTLTDPYSSLRTFFSATWPDVNGASGYFLGCFTCSCAFCYLPTAFVSSASSIYQDLVKPYYCINAEEKRQIFALKILTFTAAAVSTVLALFVSLLLLRNNIDGTEGGELWSYVKNIFLTLATLCAPFAALYVLAILLPCTNARGAIVAVLCGLAFAVTLSTLHLVRYPLDSHIQQPNSLLFRCCGMKTSLDGFYWRNETHANHSQPFFDVTTNSTSTGTANSSNSLGLARLPSVCAEYSQLEDSGWSGWHRVSPALQAVLTFILTLLIGVCVSVLTGRQDIYALDWNLVYWTCNNLDNMRLCDCCSRHGAGTHQSIADTTGHGEKKRHQRGPYTTSESFRYSKQAPLPDTSYVNPKVATLTRNNRQ